MVYGRGRIVAAEPPVRHPVAVRAEALQVTLDQRACLGRERVDLEIRPAPGRWFPPADLGGSALVTCFAPASSGEQHETI